MPTSPAGSHIFQRALYLEVVSFEELSRDKQLWDETRRPNAKGNHLARNIDEYQLIIIDEAHNVAERGKSNASMRAKLAKLLSRRSDSLIMLSATPHDGRARSFASLMNMLNPTAIPDMEDFKKEDIEKRGMFKGLFKKI